jgi:hypothetical protein
VDGYAPVYALMTRANPSSFNTTTSTTSAASEPGGEEKVAVGKLRVVLSLEDKGPGAVPAAGFAAAAHTPEGRKGQAVLSSRLNPSPSLRRTSRGVTGAPSSSRGDGQVVQQGGLLQVTPEKAAAGAAHSSRAAGELKITERQQQLQQAMGGGLALSAAVVRGASGQRAMQGGDSSNAQDVHDSQPAGGGPATTAGGTKGGLRGSRMPPLAQPPPDDGSQHQQPRSPLRALAQHQLGEAQATTDATAGQSACLHNTYVWKGSPPVRSHLHQYLF